MGNIYKNSPPLVSFRIVSKHGLLPVRGFLGIL